MTESRLGRRCLLVSLFAMALAKGCTTMHQAVDGLPTMQANRMLELTFTTEGAGDLADPALDVAFTDPGGVERVVPAFRATEGVWKVRYASPLVGTHQYRTICAGEVNAGLHGRTGQIHIEPYTGDNPLYVHGPVRVAEDGRHFAHADGTPFFWLGDTWWMGLSRRLCWPDDFQALATDRKAKSFTVVQIVAGLCPDMPPFDSRAANEAGHPWTDGYGRINPEFFNRADARIKHLVSQGLVPCIVGAWHQHIPLMGPEKMKRHWREIIARWGALPVVWCLGGEINGRSRPGKASGGLEAVMPHDADAIRASWTDTARHVKATDPFGRILGTHNVGSLNVLDDDSLLDMHFMQTGHSGLSTVQCGLTWFAAKRQAAHRAPMVWAEGNYQWLWAEGNFDDQLQRHQFWATMLAGAAGHTYGANGIWQVNRQDKPFGPSPHGFNWGTTPWDVAMKHAASGQLGEGKRFLQSLPWTDLVPVENVRFVAPEQKPINQTGAKWIWPPASRPRITLVGTAFDLPADRPIRRAALRIACDAPHGLTLNGQMVFRTNKLDYREEHGSARLFLGAGEYLKPGRNRILIRVDRDPFAAGSGLLAHFSIELTDGGTLEIASGGSWRWSQPPLGWPGDVIVLDPSEWKKVETVAAPQSAEKGLAFGTPAAHGPRCAIAGNRLWVVYVPAPFPVELSSLPPGTELELVPFNPRDGRASAARSIRSNAEGRWRWDPPSQAGDWVLVLRRP